MIRTSVYVVLRPDRRYDGKVTSIAIDRILKVKPKLSVRDVAVLLHVDIDERLFEQFLPETVVKIGSTTEILIPQIRAEVGDPNGTAEGASADSADGEAATDG